MERRWDLGDHFETDKDCQYKDCQIPDQIRPALRGRCRRTGLGRHLPLARIISRTRSFPRGTRFRGIRSLDSEAVPCQQNDDQCAADVNKFSRYHGSVPFRRCQRMLCALPSHSTSASRFGFDSFRQHYEVEDEGFSGSSESESNGIGASGEFAAGRTSSRGSGAGGTKGGKFSSSRIRA